MAWTDDRVTRLTTLWQEGLSASQIAADLGGVTRNAVIGKIHRLGMSNRDKAPGTGGKPKAVPAKPMATEGQPAVEVGVGSPKSEAAKAAAQAGSSARRPQSNPRGGAGTSSGGGTSHANPQRTAASGGTNGNAALKMELEDEAAPEFEQQQAASDDVVVPISRKLDLLQLTETTCKWPTGDPTMPGFSFCGHTSQDDKPYCEFHSKLAFQPPSERRRRR
ncbi:GcrA cell cycle regulator [Rhizobiaceae bacterium]|nr:GcrA cell cycle regulator [Rhizobiaceae bacterium]